MDDPKELKVVSTPEELHKLEQSDLCTTLYTLWDRLKERGQIAERHLFSCRNDSSVPDNSFNEFAKRALTDCDSVVDHGEVFLLAPLPYEELRDSLAKALHTALEAL